MIDRVPVRDLQVHSAARDVPDMRDEEWRPFLADVKAHGVQEPLVVQKGSVVLDGRHRLKAAQESGQKTVPARVVDLTEEEQVAHVYSAAQLRRHLADDQRAVLAARWYLAEAKAARSQRARKAGQAGGGGRKKARRSSGGAASPELPASGDGREVPASRTREKAVAQYGVPERKFRFALRLEKESPELSAKVLAGEMKLLRAWGDFKSAAPHKATTAPKEKRRRPSPGVNGSHGNGVATTDVEPQATPAEQVETGAEPQADLGCSDATPPVGRERWARWLRSALRGVDPADLAAELIHQLGVDGAAELRDALTEALKVAAV
jgi:hypothetical protein